MGGKLPNKTRNSLLLKSKIDTSKMGTPAFIMLLTANGRVAYKRPEDGMYIVPIACLKD